MEHLSPMGTQNKMAAFEFTSKSIGKDVWVDVSYDPNDWSFELTDIFTAYSDSILATYESNLDLQKEVKEIFVSLMEKGPPP